MGKLDNFDTQDLTYKTVQGVPIQATIATPKGLQAGTHPVVVHWHGGCLITGHRTYDEWLNAWQLEFARRKGAIVVFPDYRLLPEATIADIMNDLRDFYAWLAGSLKTALSARGHRLDLMNVLLTGESAGGYLTTQSALLHLQPSEVHFRAIISPYGMLDIGSAFFTENFHKRPFAAPEMPTKVLYDHIAAIKAGTAPSVVTGATPPERVPFALTSLQHGLFAELMGTNPVHFPIQNLETAPRNSLPPLWAYHGTDDSAVPAKGSIDFVDKLKKLNPEAKVMLTLQPGDHGFDQDSSIDTPWVQDGLRFIEQFWPS